MSAPATVNSGPEKPEVTQIEGDHTISSGDSGVHDKDEPIEDLEALEARATHYDTHAASHLPPDHQRYLIERHGTLDLDPLPGHGDADPYNWSSWKKTTNLVLVAFHAMMSTFTAAAIIPAYVSIAEDLGVSIQQASYLTSLQIAILGVAPLIWIPFSQRYGRRPVFIISLVCSLVANIGCAKSPSYSTMALCRAIVSFFISPAIAVGSAVVTESFFKNERAKYMGVWTMLITLGVPIAPFIFGFVAFHTGYRWIYWVLAIINGVQLALYIPFGPETRYIRQGATHEGSDFKQEYMSFRRIDPTSLRAIDFVRPFVFFLRPVVLIPAAAYSMIFNVAGVLVTVELPQLFAEKFEFNAQQLGLQFIGIIIGTVIGEQLGGVLSDKWMAIRTKKSGKRPQPEYRLWLSHPGSILSIVGLVVFLVRTQQAPEREWNVTPIVGIAIAGAGVQIVTTVLVTYSVDCYPTEAASVGVFITFVRQIWGFIGPFWFPPMFENVGVAASSGIGAALIIGVSILPTFLLQWRGKAWRSKHEEPRTVQNA